MELIVAWDLLWRQLRWHGAYCGVGLIMTSAMKTWGLLWRGALLWRLLWRGCATCGLLWRQLCGRHAAYCDVSCATCSLLWHQLCDIFSPERDIFSPELALSLQAKLVNDYAICWRYSRLNIAYLYYIGSLGNLFISSRKQFTSVYAGLRPWHRLLGIMNAVGLDLIYHIHRRIDINLTFN